MPMPDVFEKEVTDRIIERIEGLTPESQRQWGKMDVAQMLAHCCVTYEMIYEPGMHPPPNFLMSLILKLFIKRIVAGDRPLKKNSPTAPQYIMASGKDFDREKARLIEYLRRTFEAGKVEFDGKESTSFGRMNATQWSNMFYKHLDHHLTQFGG